MAIQRVADMTLHELNQMIDDAIDRRLQGLVKPQDSRTQAEIMASIRKRRFTPPEGAKSTLELLREDRDV